MKAKVALLLSPLLMIALFSCGAPTQLFSPRERSQLYAVDISLSPAPLASVSASGQGAEAVAPAAESLLPGAVLSPGDEFQVVCRALAETNSIDDIEISLLRADAAVAASSFRSADKGGADLLEMPLSLSLPDALDPGLYSIRVELFSAKARLFEKDTEVFILSAPFRILRMESRPDRVEPSSLAVIDAQLDAEAGLDPWLVWKQGEAVLSSGRLSEGGGRLLWPSPSKEGIYGITLSAWPQAPAGASSFEFPATASARSSLVVAKRPADAFDPLNRPEDFLALFRFDRGLADATGNLRPGDIRVEGEPAIGIYGSGFGYSLGPSAGMSGKGYLLPRSAGRLEPFSLIFSLLPDAGASGSLFRSSSPDESFAFDLYIDPESELCLSLSTGKGRALSHSEIFADGRLLDICLSLVPWKGGFQATWFRDDREISSSFLGIDTDILPSGGGFEMGGTGSARAIWDEFGVYSRKTPEGREPWAFCFAAATQRRWPDSFIFADGFDSTRLAEGILAVGGALKQPGAVDLPPGAMLGFSLPEDWEAGVRIEADLGVYPGSAGESPDPVFHVYSGEALALSLHADGRIFLPDGSSAGRLAPMDSDAPAFNLGRDGEGLRLSVGKSFLSIESVLPEGELRVFCGPGGEGIRLDSLRALRSGGLDGLSKTVSGPASPRS